MIALQNRRKQEEQRIKMEKELQIEEELDETLQKSINPTTLTKLKKQFEAREKELRLDRDNIIVRTFFINGFAPNNNKRKLFMFYIHKNSSVNDLKTAIKRDFGWGIQQITIYLNYQEIQDFEILQKYKDYDNEEDVLIVHFNSKRPETKLQVRLKSKMDDIKIDDVKYFNCSSDNDLIVNKDEGGLKYEFPDYWDWHLELWEINNSITLAKEELRNNLSKKESLDMLVEAENEFNKLAKNFEFTAKKAVRTIVETQATPVNIFNLYGDGGRKYVSGGLIIRHWDEWILHQKYTLNKTQCK